MKFNSSIGYRMVQKEVNDFLKAFEFKPFENDVTYRTKKNFLQFLYFQKGNSYLSGQMTISVVLKGLFAPSCNFHILQPSGGIGDFLESRKNDWWACDTPETTNETISEIKKVLSGEIIPFFDSIGSPESIRLFIEDKKFDFVWKNPTTSVDKGYFYLYAKNYDKGLQVFQQYKPSRVSKFKTIKSLIDQQRFADVDKILEDNINHAMKNLEI